MKVFAFMPEGFGTVILRNPEEVKDMLTDSDIGSEIHVSVMEMSEEELSKLPEFMGF